MDRPCPQTHVFLGVRLFSTLLRGREVACTRNPTTGSSETLSPLTSADPESFFPSPEQPSVAQARPHPEAPSLRPTAPRCSLQQREPWPLTRSRSNRMNSSPDTKVRKSVRWSWLQTRAFLQDMEKGHWCFWVWLPAQPNLTSSQLCCNWTRDSPSTWMAPSQGSCPHSLPPSILLGLSHSSLGTRRPLSPELSLWHKLVSLSAAAVNNLSLQ